MFVAGHALEGLLVGKVRRFAVDDQGVVDLAALDHSAGDVHAVAEGQAGVGDVEVLALVAEAEVAADHGSRGRLRSEEHTSALHSLIRISYVVFCLTTKTFNNMRLSTIVFFILLSASGTTWLYTL